MMTRTEEIIRKAIAEGQDPFTALAAEMHSKPLGAVTEMERQLTKRMTYQFLFSGANGPWDLKEVFHRG
ncbi:MAG: hypothetical protein JZU60_02810 [Ilumatobacteraceae bacterium]|nr:hypothetical protein [Ilumatobacteraceae bacterium]